MKDNFIDVERLIKSKNPQLLKWMPGFFLRYMKRILHEEDVNAFLRENGHLYGADFCDAAVKKFSIRTEVRGVENIPRNGGVIFAVNHPLGGMDAIVIVSAINHIRSDIKFIVNDVLLHLENLKDMFVGVNKLGKNFAESLRKVDATFASDQAVFVFPAGLVSRKKKGEIRDLEWKKTFVTRARKYQKPIVPVYIDGELSNFFYRLANIRSALGIRINIEMFYLVNEFYKQHNKRIPMAFGEPIPPESLTGERTDREWADQIKARVYEMGNQFTIENPSND